MMTWIITNHYKSPQVYHDMNHHKSEITTNHHKPWHKSPWTMTETSTKHDMNHYKSPQTMTWTIMMTQKELCIKPYDFLVTILASFVCFFNFPDRNLIILYKITWKLPFRVRQIRCPFSGSTSCTKLLKEQLIFFRSPCFAWLWQGSLPPTHFFCSYSCPLLCFGQNDVRIHALVCQ